MFRNNYFHLYTDKLGYTLISSLCDVRSGSFSSAKSGKQFTTCKLTNYLGTCHVTTEKDERNV